MTKVGRNTLETVLARVDKGEGDSCWVWTGAINSMGYGMVSFDGRRQLVHRVIYQCINGLIPAGMHSDHLCRNTRCCRPDHIEIVTARENIRRGAVGFGLTGMCRKGLHDMSDPAAVTITKDGGRLCTECRRLHRETYWRENKHRIRPPKTTEKEASTA